ncbi:MAG: nucleotide-binding protein [Desulfobulbaceae bacterium]|nr:nucleotide-binding protein [Desulfobulbaceae bacterium]
MKKKILWIDNNPEKLNEIVEEIKDSGFEVELIESASHGADRIAQSSDTFFLIIVDLIMYGDSFMVPGDKGVEILESPPGATAGMALARWIKRHYPELFTINISMKTNMYDPEVIWFKEKGDGYFDKYSLMLSPSPLLDRIRFLAARISPKGTLKTYIIHGEAEISKNELKKYLHTNLRITNPIIIREQLQRGKGILENFNFEGADFHAIFVLLTPQDPFCTSTTERDMKRKCRQNIFFEMGFFYSLCRQGKGKIFFLHKDNAELPDDIIGVHSLDISNGLKDADKVIRRELGSYLPLLRRQPVA